MMTEKAIGIDLGTTNSVVGALDLYDRRLLIGTFDQGPKFAMPSAVAWHPDERRVLVGHRAKVRRGLQPEPILSIKRAMGTQLKVRLGETSRTPPEISALVLGELARHIRRSIGQEFDVSRAVITVPAHFKQPAQEATTKAGELAGLNVIELLSEPTAAVIYYCWQRAREMNVMPPKEENFLVYDLGGGTFDVSVITRIHADRSGDTFQTRAIAGESFLGGDDFDSRIAEELLRRVEAEHGRASLDHDAPGHKTRWAILRGLAEQIKIYLSEHEVYRKKHADLLCDDRGRSLSSEVAFTREHIARLILPLARPTIEKCWEALDEAALPLSRVDTILLVGGSSRVPAIQHLVRDTFCRGKERARCDRPVSHAPEQCVGAGAALKAASHGRILQSSEVTRRVHFRGYGTFREDRASFRIGLLEGGDLASEPALTSQDGNRVAGSTLADGSSCLFRDVPLLPEQINPFTLSLPSAEGSDVAAFRLPLRHDSKFVQPLGMSTSANVLAYSLGLRVHNVSTGELDVVQLARKLSPLPGRFSYNFEIPADASALLFPIFGDEALIKTVRVPISEGLPEGTPLQLTVEIDAAQRVTCSGQIPDARERDRFRFAVEPPMPEPVPTFEDFLDLDSRREALFEDIHDEEDGRLGMRALRLSFEIRKAFDHRDEAAIIHKMNELRVLVISVEKKRTELTPSFAEMEDLIEQCGQLIEILEDQSTTLNLTEISDSVAANAAVLRKAAVAKPPQKEVYTRAAMNLEASCRTLAHEYQRILNELDPEIRAPDEIAAARRKQATVAELELNENDQNVFANACELLDQADSLVSSDPEEAIARAHKARRFFRILEQRHNTAVPEDSSDRHVNQR